MADMIEVAVRRVGIRTHYATQLLTNHKDDEFVKKLVEVFLKDASHVDQVAGTFASMEKLASADLFKGTSEEWKAVAEATDIVSLAAPFLRP